MRVLPFKALLAIAMGWVRPIAATFIIVSSSLASSDDAGNDEDEDDDNDSASPLPIG